jgi:hypothetical protein
VEEEWENSFLQTISPLVGAAVHKKVLATRVAMYITIKEDVSAFQGLAHHHLRRAILGALLHAWCDPLSVQIEATKRGPVISNQHPIWVQHRDDLKYKIVPQVLGHLIIRDQELKNALDNEGGIALSRMDPAGDDDGSSNGDLLRPAAKVGDDGHLTIVARDGFAHNGLPYSILAVRLAQVLEQLSAIGVGVGVAMRHVHLVVIILELNLERQRIVEASTFFLQGVLEVANVLAVAVPPDALAIVAVRHFLGVEQRLHALVVAALWLDQVHKVELISCELASVVYLEVKPLGVGRSIVVILEDQVVLILANFDSATQVAGFKTRFEY